MPYICEDPLIDEDKLKINYGSSDPKELSYFLAEAKAKSLSTKYRDHIILGAVIKYVFLMAKYLKSLLLLQMLIRI